MNTHHERFTLHLPENPETGDAHYTLNGSDPTLAVQVVENGAHAHYLVHEIVTPGNAQPDLSGYRTLAAYENDLDAAMRHAIDVHERRARKAEFRTALDMLLDGALERGLSDGDAQTVLLDVANDLEPFEPPTVRNEVV